MSELEEKLGSVLGNPQLMQQLQAMAQTLGQSGPRPAPEEPPAASGTGPDPQLLQKLSGIAGAGAVDSNQKALLSAMTPYVSSRKLQRLEKAMRAAKMARMASAVLGSAGAGSAAGR